MDEMNIVSKFTTTVVSKVAKMILKKKIGCDIDIWLNTMKVTVTDDNMNVHLDVDAKLSKEELRKLLKEVNLF